MGDLRPYQFLLSGLFLVLVLGSACLVRAGTPVSGKILIRVMENCLVNGDEILLGEMAQIRASDFLLQELKALGLGNAPKPGRVKAYEKKRILSLIRSHPLVNEDMEIICPDRVYIKGQSQSIEKALIRERLEQYLKARFEPRSLEIKTLKVRGLEPYPGGDLELGIQARDPVNRNGRLLAYMDVTVDGIHRDRLRISGTMAQYEDVVCAARDLEKGVKIRPGDLEIQRLDVFSFRASPLKDMAKARGKTLKRSVLGGQPLDSGLLVLTPVVEKGDIVTLVAGKNNLRITATGIIREDGYAREPVLVENLSSGKALRGIVRDHSTVEIAY